MDPLFLTLFTAEKAGKLWGMFVFYCVVRFLLYRVIVNFVGIKILRISLIFLSMIIYEPLGIRVEAMQSWWFHWQLNHNETKGLHGLQYMW